MRQAQLLIILAVAGCSGPNYHKLPTRFRQPFSAAGRLSPKTTIPLHFVRELKVPAESLGYSMSASVAISAGVIGNRCIIAVSDVVDRAVHWFDKSGNYVGTFSGGSRDTTHLPMPLTVAVGGGRILVGDWRTRRVNIVDPIRADTREFKLTAPVPATPPGFRLAADSGGIYELWIATQVTRGPRWPEQGLPLVRAFNWTGTAADVFGTVENYPGRAFTSALNVGYIAVRAGSLYVANAAAARVDIYAMGSPDQGHPTRSDTLSVLFQPRPPIELYGDSADEGEALVEYHLRGFSVAPNGDEIFLQALSYPKYSRALTRYAPEVVLTIARHGTGQLSAYSTQLRPLAVTATGDALGIILLDTLRNRTRVALFRYPRDSSLNQSFRTSRGGTSPCDYHQRPPGQSGTGAQ